MTSPPQQISPSDVERFFSAERLSTYLAQCNGDFAAAVEMYRWNSAITAAFWEPIGHLEVALRNTLDDRARANAPGPAQEVMSPMQDQPIAPRASVKCSCSRGGSGR